MRTVPRVPLDHHPATYEDLVAVPEHLVAEILDGELYASPRPAPRHALTHTRLAMMLAPFDLGPRGPGGWTILLEPELHLGRDVLVPDMAGWRHERMPRLPETAYFPLAPDWLCEIISPATGATDRTKKLPIYAREGVAFVWMIDPNAYTLEILSLQRGRWVLGAAHAGRTAVRAQPFEAIELDLGLLWYDEPPASVAP